MDVDLKSQRISDLLDRIGKLNLYRQFSSDLIQRINPGNSLFYDITSVPSYSSARILEYDHVKDHPDLKQIKLCMVMKTPRNIPLFLEIGTWSIPDFTKLKMTFEGNSNPIPKMEIILVSEFFSY